jgi:hypothetical protein
MGADKSRHADGPPYHARVPRLALVAGLLAALGTLAGGGAVPAQESLRARCERVENMSQAEKTALLDKKRRFDELSLDDQERLRTFEKQLSQDPDQERLRRILERYHAWLYTLPTTERAEILSLPADQRVKKISELMSAEKANRQRAMAMGRKMNPADLAVIYGWFDTFLDAHAQEILATLPDEPFAKFKKEYDVERDRVVLGRLYAFSRSPDVPRPSPSEEQQLQTQVSKDAREVLADADPERRSQIIRWWIGAAVLSHLGANPSLDELHKFAEESLSEQQRLRLESLPADQMYRELRFLYNQQRFGDPGRQFPWGPGGPAGPPPHPPGDPSEGPKGPPPGGAPPWEGAGPPGRPDR